MDNKENLQPGMPLDGVTGVKSFRITMAGSGAIDSISHRVSVPLPAMLWLFATALAGFAGLGYWRKACANLKFGQIMDTTIPRRRDFFVCHFTSNAMRMVAWIFTPYNLPAANAPIQWDRKPSFYEIVGLDPFIFSVAGVLPRPSIL